MPTRLRARKPSRRATCQPIIATAGTRTAGIECWLPEPDTLRYINYITLMRQILPKRCFSNLANPVTFNTTYSQRRHLRSSTSRSAAVRRTRTQFGKRAFSVCGPGVWNSLPTALRNIDSYPLFIRALKSHIFSCAFSSLLFSHSFTDIVGLTHSRPCFCRLGTKTFIVYYCVVFSSILHVFNKLRVEWVPLHCWLVTDTRPRRLRSVDTRALLVSWTRTNLGDRAFSAAGPRVWNYLLADLRRPDCHKIQIVR